jgi:hypothetical protein
MGPQDRNWSFTKNFRMGKMITDSLNAMGIAVFRYDDRGFGQSTGTKETLSAFDTLAQDVITIARFLSRKPGVSATGLLGHSLGGILSVMAASKERDIDFIITLSGSYRTGGDIMMEQATTLKRWKTAPDMNDAQIIQRGEAFVRNWVSYANNGPGLDSMKQILRSLVAFQIGELNAEEKAKMLEGYPSMDSLIEKEYLGVLEYYTSPHQLDFAKTDPVAYFKNVTCPVLVMMGEKDEHVTVAANLPKITAAITGHPGLDLTLHIVPGADHAYSNPESFRKGEMLQGVCSYMANWILSKK